MIRYKNQEEAAEIERRVRALSQGIDALKDDALSLFVAHRHKATLCDGLATLIQGLDSAWQCCSLETVVAESASVRDSKETGNRRC